jgi:signal transduction histidine kinase
MVKMLEEKISHNFQPLIIQPNSMTKISIIIISFLLPVTLNAQNRLIDSVKLDLNSIKTDSAKVNAYNELSFLYRLVNIDTAIFYGNAGHALSKKIQYHRGQCRALQVLGHAYRQSGDLTKALGLLFQALQIANDHNFIEERGLCLRRIGLIHEDLSNWPLARDYNYKAIQDYITVDDKRSLAMSYMNVAYYFDKEQKYDSARYFIQQSAKILHFAPELHSGFFQILGELEYHLGNFKASMEAFTNGKKWAIYYSDYTNLCVIHGFISRVYGAQNQVDSSVKNADLAIFYGKKINFRLGLLRIYEFLSSYYDKKDPAKALNYLKEYNAVRESLYGTKNMQAMQHLVVAEAQRQQEIIEVEKAYQNKIKMYALLGGLIVLLLVAVMFYRNSVNQKKSRILLQQQKNELEQSLRQLKTTQTQLIQAEKMASLGELTAGIAHEIQNPLNFVNNFSEVSTELVDEMKSEIKKGNYDEVNVIADDVKQNLEKINHHGQRAADIVKGMLQHSRSSSGVKEPTDINALADEYFRLAYHGLRAKDKTFNATMKTDFDESIGKINIIPKDIGRVVLNLITNAFYAVNEKSKQGIADYEPTVSVVTKKINHQVEIRVTDNGNGIPAKIVDKIFQPFFTTKPTGQGTGLGLSLSYDIVKAHGGELKVETKEGMGSDFIIQLPIV